MENSSLREQYGVEDSTDLRTEIKELLNKYSRENISDTPDYVLRDYLWDCLKSYERAIEQRRHWFNIQGKTYDIS